MNKLIRFSILAGCLLISACASQPPIKESKELSAGVMLRAEDQTAWQSSLLLIKQQKWPEAKLALQNLIKTNPQFTGALINLAAVNCELHQWQEAAGVLNRLPETQKSPRVFNLLGLVAEHSGQITQAEQYYLAAVANAAAPPEAHYNLALLYDIYWQDPIKALPFYENYARARPEDKAVGDWIIEIKRKAKR
jgi:tetratricopeptide (TPR) repeat protein